METIHDNQCASKHETQPVMCLEIQIMKRKKTQKHIVGAVPKSNHKIVERGENQHPLIATSI